MLMVIYINMDSGLLNIKDCMQANREALLKSSCQVRTGGDQHWVGKQILNMMAMEKEKEKEKGTKGEEEKKKQ